MFSPVTALLGNDDADDIVVISMAIAITPGVTVSSRRRVTTIGELLTVMARHLLESDQTLDSGLWTRDEAIANIASADKTFLTRTGLVKNIREVTAAALVGEYAEPPETIDIERLSWNGQKLYPQTRWELDRQKANWQGDATKAPRRYYRDGVSVNYFGVWPAPSAAAVGTGWIVTGGDTFGVIRGISGNRAYTVTGSYGVVRQIKGTQNYLIGGSYLASGYPFNGTIRLMRSGKTNFTAIYDVHAPTQTLGTDQLVTPAAFSRYVMYGALGMLWEKQGDGQDLARAQYCQSRFERGVQLARRLVYGAG